MTATSWISTVRREAGPKVAHQLVLALVERCGSDAKRLDLLYRVYGMVLRPRDLGALDPEEFGYVRSLKPLFLTNDAGPAFISCVGWTIHHEWNDLKALLEQVLDEMPGKSLDGAVSRLADGVYWAIREGDRSKTPPEIGQWLLNQVLRPPDIDRVQGMMDWEINETLKIVGRAPVAWLPAALLRRREMEAAGGEGETRAVGHESRLSRYVEPISEADVSNPAVRQAIADLVGLVPDRGTVGYYLDQIIHDVDPAGLLAPEEIARRVTAASDHDQAWQLARLGGGYPTGGQAWRTVARPVLLRASTSTTREERVSLFNALTDHRPKVWSGAIGEVPALFVRSVDEARRQLQSESDADFRPFWEWLVAIAEADLRDQEERAKEDRGE
jgi:hypothetical protein